MRHHVVIEPDIGTPARHIGRHRDLAALPRGSDDIGLVGILTRVQNPVGNAGIVQQLAEQLIALDLLRETTREGDPRIVRAERTVRVIEARIEDEKRKLGLGASDSSSDAFASLVGEYESLIVDREFAEQTYTAALAAYDAAQAEARRQTRYLAAHVTPTLAEKSLYPQRITIAGLITLFAFLIWTLVVLVAYSLRDRH